MKATDLREVRVVRTDIESLPGRRALYLAYAAESDGKTFFNPALRARRDRDPAGASGPEARPAGAAAGPGVGRGKVQGFIGEHLLVNLAVLMHASYTGWLMVLFPATSFGQGLAWQTTLAAALWLMVVVVIGAFGQSGTDMEGAP